MKSKYTAAILALFLGGAGFHRFYLGQRGLGMMYLGATLIGMFLPPFRLFMFIPVVLSFVDAFSFLLMNADEFDYKYNRDFEGEGPGRARRPQRTRKYRNKQQDSSPGRYRRQEYRKRERMPSPEERREKLKKSHPQSKHNPFKLSGIKKFKDFDIKAAIEDFEKGLEISPNDISLHFNLACSYSLDENVESGFYYLGKSVELGFNDFDKIKMHDALAFLRIHPSWEEFEQNGYSNRKQLEPPKENLLDNDQLLTHTEQTL